MTTTSTRNEVELIGVFRYKNLYLVGKDENYPFFSAKIVVSSSVEQLGKKWASKTFVPIKAVENCARLLSEVKEGSTLQVFGYLDPSKFDTKCKGCNKAVNIKTLDVFVTSFKVLTDA